MIVLRQTRGCRVAIEIRQLHRPVRGNLEYASVPDDMAPDLNCGVHRSRALNVRDMKIHGVAAATRDHFETVWHTKHFDRVTADVMAIQSHRSCHRLEIRPVVALRHRSDHRAVLPACPAKVRGRGNF